MQSIWFCNITVMCSFFGGWWNAQHRYSTRFAATFQIKFHFLFPVSPTFTIKWFLDNQMSEWCCSDVKEKKKLTRSIIIRSYWPLQKKILQYTIMLFVCHPKILHKHCLQFLLGVNKNGPKRNWKQCLCKILTRKPISIMVCYGIFCSGQKRCLS